MPIYEYICKECDEEIEIMQGLNDPVPECEECGGEMERQISLSSFRLVGGGWYESEYGKKKKIVKKKIKKKAKK